MGRKVEWSVSPFQVNLGVKPCEGVGVGCVEKLEIQGFYSEWSEVYLSSDRVCHGSVWNSAGCYGTCGCRAATAYFPFSFVSSWFSISSYLSLLLEDENLDMAKAIDLEW